MTHNWTMGRRKPQDHAATNDLPQIASPPAAPTAKAPFRPTVAGGNAP
jgi:hypothetical protein